MNYYEHHLGDYAKDTAHLSMLETGAYRLLLDRYYGTEQGIPADQVYRLARARSKDEKDAVDAVLTEFFCLENGVWLNRRAEEEIAKAQAKINAARGNGAKGGRPKKLNLGSENETQQKPSGLFVGSENATQSKAHQTPDTKHQTPDKEYQTTTVHLAREPVVVDPPLGPPEPDPTSLRAIELTALLRQRGAKLQASDPNVRRWAEQGVSDAQALAALEKALQQRADKADSSPVNSGYLESILKSAASPGPRRSKPTLAEQNAAAAEEAKRMIFGEQAHD